MVCSVAVTMWRLLTEGQAKRRESVAHDPRLAAARDYSAPLICLINADPLSLSPLLSKRRAALCFFAFARASAYIIRPRRPARSHALSQFVHDHTDHIIKHCFIEHREPPDTAHTDSDFIINSLIPRISKYTRHLDAHVKFNLVYKSKAKMM